jgi:hypothetical protein
MAKASIWMRRRRRRASQAIRPMVMHRKRRTRLLRRQVRPQRMIASLPIEATRARFQTRPSNWLLQFSAALAGSCQSIYEPAVCRSRTPVASYQARSAACGLSSAILSQKAAMSCLWMPTWGVACHRQPHEATEHIGLILEIGSPDAIGNGPSASYTDAHRGRPDRFWR